MGIDVERISDGLVDMVWPWEVELCAASRRAGEPAGASKDSRGGLVYLDCGE